MLPCTDDAEHTVLSVNIAHAQQTQCVTTNANLLQAVQLSSINQNLVRLKLFSEEHTTFQNLLSGQTDSTELATGYQNRAYTAERHLCY